MSIIHELEVIYASNTLPFELKRRFRKFTDPGDAKHNALFLMATALDPRYRLLLNPTQTCSAKAAIQKEVCFMSNQNLLHMHDIVCKLINLIHFFCGACTSRSTRLLTLNLVPLVIAHQCVMSPPNKV